MSVGEDSGPIHPVATRRNHRRYLFYDKHHGRVPDAARWLPTLTPDEEFAVFDTADFHDLANDRGWLYGLRPRDGTGHIPDLGTWGQQVAEFPLARPQEVWHGYPLWPLVDAGPANRRGEKGRPAKEVFRKMEETGLITTIERKRLFKGAHT